MYNILSMINHCVIWTNLFRPIIKKYVHVIFLPILYSYLKIIIKVLNH